MKIATLVGQAIAYRRPLLHVSGHKTQKTFMDYIKHSSDEIAAIANVGKSEVF